MKKFRINTIIVGFIFLTVFTCGEAPVEVFSPVGSSVETVAVVSIKKEIELKLEKISFFSASKRSKHETDSIYTFSENSPLFFCSFTRRALPPRASPLI
ncbi:hypothetical protein [Desulfurobacterium sp.]